MAMDLLGIRSSGAFGRALAQLFLEKHAESHAGRQKPLELTMGQQVKSFMTSNRLNLISRAHLANEFRWALRDGGLSPELQEQWTEWLVVQIAGKK
jgi:hypothetical protein